MTTKPTQPRPDLGIITVAKSKKKRPAPVIATHCDCGAELFHGDCPACDPWPEDDWA